MPNSFLPFAITLAKTSGKLILEQSQKNFKIEEKTKNDYVTAVDKAAEQLIIKKILKEFPDHGILAEESSFKKTLDPKNYKNHKFVWIIDPIDGTNNFIRGIPFYTISIALQKEGELIVGVLFAPALNKLYYAEKGKGAFLNGKKIHVSKTPALEHSLFATGFHGEYKIKNLPYFEKIIARAQGIRRFGSAALDLAMVAEGKFDSYWEFGLKPWDIAAGALIVKEAGGKVTNLKGKPLDLFDKNILASNGLIHKETVKILKATSFHS